MARIDFLSSIHKGTKRDYLARVLGRPKSEAAALAKQWGFDYWDGDRSTGYGGFHYDGRWRTVAEALAEHYRLSPGDRVLDVGCGKAFLLYELTQVVPAAAILEILGPAGADVVIDNTGSVEVIRSAFELTAASGRTILVGVPRAGSAASLQTFPLHFGKVLTGSHGGGSRPAEDIPRFERMIRDGKLDLQPLVTNTFSLKRINDAINAMRSGETAGRVFICMS